MILGSRDSAAIPSFQELGDARDQFRSLLAEERTTEAAWQQLFSECPHILSTALPLDLSPVDIIPGARPGVSEADFLIHGSAGLFGVIELKRPSTPILTKRPPRSGLLQLSHATTTAVAQAHLYAEGLDRRLAPENSLFLGCRPHLFVIVGMSDELATKLVDDLVPRLNDQLRGCRLLTFDQVLSAFEERVARRALVLRPVLPDSVVLNGIELLRIDGGILHYPKRGPVHSPPWRPCSVATFYIGKHQVTLEQYEQMRSGDRSLSKPRAHANERLPSELQPLVGITGEEAREFCLRAQGHLPTRTELCYAVETQTPFGGDGVPFGGEGGFPLRSIGGVLDQPTSGLGLLVGGTPEFCVHDNKNQPPRLGGYDFLDDEPEPWPAVHYILDGEPAKIEYVGHTSLYPAYWDSQHSFRLALSP